MLIPPRKHSINPPPKIITLDNLSLLGVKISIVDKYSSTRTFAPSSNYASESGYMETLSEFIETANRYPEYKWDYRKLADYMIAECYLGIRPTK